MTPAASTLEALKLRLIQDNTKAHADLDPLLTQDGIRYLIKALAYADVEFSAEIEHVLVKAGALALPGLLAALEMDQANMRSVCAMALIRLGSVAEPAILDAYVRQSAKPTMRWVLQFILQELGAELPATAAPKAAYPRLVQAG